MLRIFRAPRVAAGRARADRFARKPPDGEQDHPERTSSALARNERRAASATTAGVTLLKQMERLAPPVLSSSIALIRSMTGSGVVVANRRFFEQPWSSEAVPAPVAQETGPAEAWRGKARDIGKGPQKRSWGMPTG